MRDINRIDNFCDELKEIWKRVPDWRFFQLISNYTRACNSDCFYVEDEMAIDELANYIKEIIDNQN